MFALAQALERCDGLGRQIEQAEHRIRATMDTMAPSDSREGEALALPARTGEQRTLQRALRALLGVDLTAIPTIGVETALSLAAEVGPDLSRFPTCEHLCSWLTLAPMTRISAGRARRGRGARHFNRAGQALCLAASSAQRSRSFIGASHRARLRRLDGTRAFKATAHQLARLIYAMLARGEDYVERGIAHFESERRERQLRHLQRQARHFNLTLVPAEQAA